MDEREKFVVCFFCSYTTNDLEKCKEHEFYVHIKDTLFPNSPGIIPDYQIYPYRTPTLEERQYILCVIGNCESIVTGRNLTRHVMYSHCQDTPPLQCKYCSKFFDNHVSVLYHATQCKLGVINKFFHDDELKLLKFCVDNKPGLNIYKECFKTYLNHNFKHLENNNKTNNSVTFPKLTVGLTLKLMQRFLNAFFKGKTLQRHQLEEVFSVTDRSNFDEIYNFFHSVASLFPELLNALVPTIQCCENRFTEPSLCKCNRIIIPSLPTGNETIDCANLSFNIPSFIQAPNGIYHYTLNPNPFFINGTHPFYKIIDGINLDSDGIYGVLLTSAIYADIFDFMQMDDGFLNRRLTNIGYTEHKDRENITSIIKSKYSEIMNILNSMEENRNVPFNNVFFIPTCFFHEDKKANVLKKWRDDVNNRLHDEKCDKKDLKINNYSLLFLPAKVDYTFRHISSFDRVVSPSKLGVALKKIFSLYTSVPEEIVDECLKRINFTHVYYCINNIVLNDIDNNSNYDPSDSDDDTDYDTSSELNVRSHSVHQLELDFFEVDTNYDNDSESFDKMVEIPNNVDNGEEVEQISANTNPLMVKLDDVNDESINNHNIPYILGGNNFGNIQNHVANMVTYENNVDNNTNTIDHFWNPPVDMNIPYTDAFENNLNLPFYIQHQPTNFINNVNNETNLQNQTIFPSRNTMNQEMMFKHQASDQLTNTFYPEPTMNNQPNILERNFILDQVNIVNNDINFKRYPFFNICFLQEMCLDNLVFFYQEASRILFNRTRESRHKGTLNRTIQKNNIKRL